MTNKKTIVVSGIRASGRLHIGNYLGALKQFAQLQNDPALDCYFFIADLHAITTPFTPDELKSNTLEVVADYLAAGIDPKKCTFFVQSQVTEHAELAWIFDCIMPLGELFRMTQFKEKAGLMQASTGKSSSETRDDGKNIMIMGGGSINAGLLTYPCLMAADILMYKANAVPVGEDQVQHVELTRIVARKFNHKFGATFPEPKTYTRQPLRVMSLTDPTKKMSKTPHQSLCSGTGQAGDEGALLLDDSPKEISRKLKKAVTATSGGDKSPGVENLFLLLDHFGTAEQISKFKKLQTKGVLKYSELKETLAQTISEHFAEFRKKKKELMSSPRQLAEVMAFGQKKAEVVARQTLAEVKQKIGLII